MSHDSGSADIKSFFKLFVFCIILYQCIPFQNSKRWCRQNEQCARKFGLFCSNFTRHFPRSSSVSSIEIEYAQLLAIVNFYVEELSFDRENCIHKNSRPHDFQSLCLILCRSKSASLYPTIPFGHAHLITLTSARY